MGTKRAQSKNGPRGRRSTRTRLKRAGMRKLLSSVRSFFHDTKSYLSAHWAGFAFLLGVVVLLISTFRDGIAIFQPLDELKHKQKECKNQEQEEAFNKKTALDHLTLGNKFLNLGEFEAAKQEFDRALQAQPHNVEAQRGHLKASLLEPFESPNSYEPDIFETRIRHFLKNHKEDPHASLCLGALYLSTNPDTAYKYLRDAIKGDSVSVAYYLQGLLYTMQRNFGSARASLEKAKALSPNHTFHLVGLSVLYYHDRKYDTAFSHAESFFRREPSCLLAYCNYSNVCRLTGKFELAFNLQDQLCEFLEDTMMTSFKKNRIPWFVPTEAEIAVLQDVPQKRWYALHDIALTLYLLGKEKDAANHVKRAPRIAKFQEKNAKSILDFHIKRLQEEARKRGYSEVVQRSEKFARTYLRQEREAVAEKKGRWRLELGKYYSLRPRALEFKDELQERCHHEMQRQGVQARIVRVKQGESYSYGVSMEPFYDQQAAFRMRDLIDGQGLQGKVVATR